MLITGSGQQGVVLSIFHHLFWLSLSISDQIHVVHVHWVVLTQLSKCMDVQCSKVVMKVV